MMKRRSKVGLSVVSTDRQSDGQAGSPELPGSRASPSSSCSHSRAASPSTISYLLQEGSPHHPRHPHQQPMPSSPPPPIRIRTPPPPSQSSSPAPSPMGSPAASPRTAALQLLSEPAPCPDNSSTRRLLFLPKKHGKKISCAGRVEEVGAFEPLKPQLRDRLASQPLQPSPSPILPGDEGDHDSGALSAYSSGVVSAAGSRSISRASSSSFLGPPHAAGPTSASPTAGGFSFAFPREAGADNMEGKGNKSRAASAALADFSLAEPTPRMPGEQLQLEDPLLMAPARETPVRFGAVIRLWVAEEGSSGGGGFLGFAARDVRRLQGHMPQSGRLNMGMNDTFFVLPPYKPGLGWHSRETYFRVEDPRGSGSGAGAGAHRTRDGEAIRYGEELLLVDEEDHVMCHFRGRRYIRRKPKGTKGEMTVAFLPAPAQADRLGHEIFYGDAGIRVRLQTRKGLRTEGVILSALKRESIDAVGGFLNCLGRGRDLTFDIEHAPPRIHDVSVTSTLAYGGRVYLNRMVHHRVHWGQQVAFAAPACQGHTAEAHEGCVIRVTLSNGARLKMRQEQVSGLADRVRYCQQHGSEVWLPTKGIPGEDVDLLVRLMPLETVPLDPHRLFVANEPRAGSGLADGATATTTHPGGLSWRWLLDAPLLLLEGLRELLPLGPVAVFAVASLASGLGEPHAVGRTLLLLLASAAAYLGVLHLLEGLLALLQWLLPFRLARALLGLGQGRRKASSASAAPVATAATAIIASAAPAAAELPTSMLFDRWELAVLDWRVPPDAADGDALAGSYRHGATASPPVPPPVPLAFLEAEKGDMDKARARWERTLAWRRERDVDGALGRAHPKFRLMKRLYPQAFHFRDREGHVCFYELLGRLQVQALLRAGVGIDDLVEHITLQQEFLWGVLQPREEDRVLLVMDLKGVSFADVTGEVITFAKAAVGLTSTHYPARSFRTLIINTPSWFSVVFRIIRPMLNEDTRRKIVFLEESAVRDGAMLAFIAPEFLPKEYGGACDVPLGESPFEKQLLSIVETAMAEHDVAFVDKDKSAGLPESSQEQRQLRPESEESEEEADLED